MAVGDDDPLSITRFRRETPLPFALAEPENGKDRGLLAGMQIVSEVAMGSSVEARAIWVLRDFNVGGEW